MLRQDTAPRVVALVPTHHGTAAEATITSLLAQTVPVEVLVVADNCAPDTARRLRAFCQARGATYIETVGNRARKAGALNQGLRRALQDADYVLCLDDDTVLAPDVIEQGYRVFEGRPRIGAVCSRAGVTPYQGTSHLGQLLHRYQKIEYGSFDAVRVGTPGRIQVVSGMCAFYQAEALRGLLTEDGHIYDETSIVEDHDLTIRLRRAGWRTDLSLDMHAWTEVPTTLGTLWRQRERWYSGAVRELVTKHHLDRVTLPEFGSHAMFIGLSVVEIVILCQIASRQSFTVTFLAALVWACFYGLALYRLSYVQDLDAIDVVLRLPPADIPYRLFMSAALVNGYAKAFTAKKDW